MNHSPRRFALAVAALAAATCSCGSPRINEGPATGRSSHSFQQEMNRVYFTDRSLAAEGEDGYSKIAVEGTGGRPSLTGNLEAWATLRNRSNHDAELEYQATFYDSHSAPVDEGQAWQRIFLGPQQTKTVLASSTVPMSRAPNYVIQVREGR